MSFFINSTLLMTKSIVRLLKASKEKQSQPSIIDTKKRIKKAKKTKTWVAIVISISFFLSKHLLVFFFSLSLD